MVQMFRKCLSVWKTMQIFKYAVPGPGVRRNVQNTHRLPSHTPSFIFCSRDNSPLLKNVSNHSGMGRIKPSFDALALPCPFASM